MTSLAAFTSRNGVVALGNRRVVIPRKWAPPPGTTVRGGIVVPERDAAGKPHAPTLDLWKGITFDGTEFRSEGGLFMLLAYEPELVAFRRCRFTGHLDPQGLIGGSVSIRAGSKVSFSDCDFERAGVWLGFQRTREPLVEDCRFTHIREGVQLVGTTGAAVLRNRFQLFAAQGGNHGDAIQMFTAGLTRPDDHAARDTRIEDNIIIMPGGASAAQGIFIRDEAQLHRQGRGFAGVTLRRNIVVGAAWWAIGFADDTPASGVVAEDNLVAHVPHPASRHTGAWLRLPPNAVSARNRVF